MPDETKKSDLESAVDDLGKVATGVFGRLFGPKAVGKERIDAEPATLSPEADKAIAEVSQGFGKLLHAVGEGLKQHPADPLAAVNTFAEKAQAGESPPELEGWSALSSGAKTLGEGLGSVAESVLDAVAPRRHKTADAPTDAPDEAPDAAPATEVPPAERDASG